MAGFEGFEEVRRELWQNWRDSLVNLVLRVRSIERVGARDFVTGIDLSSGRRVVAVLAERRTYPGRPSLEQRVEEAGPGGTLVLTDCGRNRNGTFEAFNALPFPSDCPVLVDGVARVSAPWMRDDGTWRQSVQHLRTGRAAACGSYADVVDAVLAALSNEGPGRSGAVVRGWHATGGGAMGFEVGLLFDPEERRYLDACMSFDAFLACPDVFVAGLGTTGSGDHCMGIVSRLLDEHPDEIAWEVIPKRTYGLGGPVAEAAGMGTGRDASRPYRRPDGSRGTGCLPSVVAFVNRDGVLWPKVAAPLRTGSPVPELRVATARFAPDVGRRPPETRLRMAGTTAAACDLLPRVAAAGPGSPDLGGVDGTRTEDMAALALAAPSADRGVTPGPG